MLRETDWLDGARRFPGELRLPGAACLVRAETRVERRRRHPHRDPLLHLLPRPHRGARPPTAIRGHWAIENRLHWVLDVTFADDQSRLRKGHGARNMATVRHFALNLVRTATDKRSIKSRRKIAGWDPDYLDAILSSRPPELGFGALAGYRRVPVNRRSAWIAGVRPLERQDRFGHRWPLPEVAMLLTCPNCHAEYDVPDGMIPAMGRHVQCSACHTRWFVTGTPRVLLTEEQILHRLESWTPRPRPLAVAPQPEPEVVDTSEDEADPAEPPSPPTPIRRVAPAKPGERPTVARPAVVAPANPAAVPAPVAPLRPALRLDLDPALDPAPVAAPPRSRFGAGLLLALLLAALAFAAYQQGGPLAAGVPAAAPALEVYSDAVDDARTAVEAQLAPLRKALDGP